MRGKWLKRRHNIRRPYGIDPEIWAATSEYIRGQWLAEWAAEATAGLGPEEWKDRSSSSAHPAAPAFPAKDPDTWNKDPSYISSLWAEPDSHRPFTTDYGIPFPARVARPVDKRERANSPAAQEALRKEWTRLRDIGCWDESKPREWSEVAKDSRDSGVKSHVGRIFDICVEKNSELPEGHPNRKYKGRVVFQGNHVRDENWECCAIPRVVKLSGQYGGGQNS